MSMMNETTTTFNVALRVQANRAPPSTLGEWEIALALANVEIQKQVSDVVRGLFQTESVVDVDTTLTVLCQQATLCAEIEVEITIDNVASFPTLVVDYLVVGALRRWVTENEDVYEYMSDAKLTWLGPNRSATLIGWQVDGLSSKMSTEEAEVFNIEIKGFLNNLGVDTSRTCEKVIVLHQFVDGSSRLKIHTALLGTGDMDDSVTYQDEALQVFNDNTIHSFVQQLDSSDPFFEPAFRVQAFGLNYNDVSVGIERSPRKPVDESNLGLNFFNTTIVGIGLALIAAGVILSGVAFVALKKNSTREGGEIDDEVTAGVG